MAVEEPTTSPRSLIPKASLEVSPGRVPRSTIAPFWTQKRGKRSSPWRRADHLAKVVDTGSVAGGATWESAEVDHYPFFKQKRVRISARRIAAPTTWPRR